MTLHVSGALSITCFALLFAFAPRVLPQGKIEAPALLDPVEAEREARVLVAELLAQKPDENITNLGRLIIQQNRTSLSEIPLRLETITTATNWLSVYETVPVPVAKPTKAERLVVVHTHGRPNQYLLSEPGSPGTVPRILAGNQSMTPFAGSDFWVADLGFEFLFWPKQTLLRKEMKNNKFCNVLESVNPNPASQGYARVVSWITADKPHGPAHAEAYDASGKKLKAFDPKTIEKVEGVYQVHSVEMRNLRARSRTVMEFNSDTD